MAILSVKNVTKRFVLEQDRPQSFKEAFVGAMLRRSSGEPSIVNSPSG